MNEMLQLTDEQLDCHVTIFDAEQMEMLPAVEFDTTRESDILDVNHPYIEV
jgi:hypothetical protein